MTPPVETVRVGAATFTIYTTGHVSASAQAKTLAMLDRLAAGKIPPRRRVKPYAVLVTVDQERAYADAIASGEWAPTHTPNKEEHTMSTTTTTAAAKPTRAATRTPAKGKRRAASAPAPTADRVAAGLAFTETAKGATGKPISQRPTAKETAKARRVLARMKGATIPAKLGMSERELQAFVRGNVPMVELSDDARAAVKTLTARIDSHQVWARKAAAIAYGLHKTAA